jgi:hypothetical protein
MAHRNPSSLDTQHYYSEAEKKGMPLQHVIWILEVSTSFVSEKLATPANRLRSIQLSVEIFE